MNRVLLIKFGEIGLKGGNRRFFERVFIQRMKDALTGLPGELPWIKRTRGRFVLDLEHWPAGPVIERLGRVFGVVELAPALVVTAELGAISGAARQVLEEALAEYPAARAVRFRVASRRADKRFPVNSMELNRILGAHLLQSDRELKVDLHDPEITVEVEVREEGAYAYARTYPGPGGLPVGSSGKGILLLSGGIDSPVAGWMSLKRGLELEAVHFQSFPFTSERAQDKALDLARALAPWAGGTMRVHLAPFTAIQRSIRENCPGELGVTLMRRMMFRVAEALAGRAGAGALVTGENLGQVASQTLESLAVIAEASDLLVLRPLVGMDKTEIIDLARRIGTFDISARPYEDCCSLFVPRHPATRPRREAVARAEARLALPALLEQALAGVKTVDAAPR
ncbi:MAG: tRNA uracil 4-sulfurtransferase ThiI [bacterium]|nr:tRNA uracil 4-sulfurtransferase ThiI [bacterium]